MSAENTNIDVDKIVKHWIEKVKILRSWIKMML
jgi:hypothetical protein